MAEQKHTAEFESCVEQVMEQGHDKGSAFAICTDAFKKAGKPIFTGESEKQKLHLLHESFRLEGNKVSGVAIHPKRIFHPEEGVTHVYLREELEKAAPTLIGKPFGIDHQSVLPPPNIVTNAWYCPEQEGVCFEGVVDDRIAKEIRRKAFKGFSVKLSTGFVASLLTRLVFYRSNQKRKASSSNHRLQTLQGVRLDTERAQKAVGENNPRVHRDSE